MREEDITTDLICNVALHTSDLHQFTLFECAGSAFNIVNCESDRVVLSNCRGCIIIYFQFNPNTDQHNLVFMVRGLFKAKKKFTVSSEGILKELFKAVRRDKGINYQDFLNVFLKYETLWGKSNTQKIMEGLQ